MIPMFLPHESNKLFNGVATSCANDEEDFVAVKTPVGIPVNTRSLAS